MWAKTDKTDQIEVTFALEIVNSLIKDAFIIFELTQFWKSRKISITLLLIIVMLKKLNLNNNSYDYQAL